MRKRQTASDTGQ